MAQSTPRIKEALLRKGRKGIWKFFCTLAASYCCMSYFLHQSPAGCSPCSHNSYSGTCCVRSCSTRENADFGFSLEVSHHILTFSALPMSRASERRNLRVGLGTHGAEDKMYVSNHMFSAMQYVVAQILTEAATTLRLQDNDIVNDVRSLSAYTCSYMAYLYQSGYSPCIVLVCSSPSACLCPMCNSFSHSVGPSIEQPVLDQSCSIAGCIGLQIDRACNSPDKECCKPRFFCMIQSLMATFICSTSEHSVIDISCPSDTHREINKYVKGPTHLSSESRRPFRPGYGPIFDSNSRNPSLNLFSLLQSF